jgi:thiosulfate/3-mercaptopyruvate sulfurtransferase
VHADITPLVDVDWVKANGCNKEVVLLDIRNEFSGASKFDYLRGHIPCAVYSDYVKDNWRTEVDGVPGQLPPKAQLEKLIGGLGIDNDSHVVIYHAGTSALDTGSATRVYWTLKVLGHDKVSILDGGFNAYTGDGRNPLEKGNKEPQARKFVARVRQEMLPSKHEVKQLLDAGAVAVDNRPHTDFMGVNQYWQAKRKGTLPGAKNLPQDWFTVHGGGKFRTKETLASLYQASGVPTEGKVVSFCNTGHWATLGWFASSELMGNKQAMNYDGSFTEWSADPSLPVEIHVNVPE